MLPKRRTLSWNPNISFTTHNHGIISNTLLTTNKLRGSNMYSWGFAIPVLKQRLKKIIQTRQLGKMCEGRGVRFFWRRRHIPATYFRRLIDWSLSPFFSAQITRFYLCWLLLSVSLFSMLKHPVGNRLSNLWSWVHLIKAPKMGNRWRNGTPPFHPPWNA